MTVINVLLVDDDATDRYIARYQLSRSDQIGKILEAEDGAAALAMFVDGTIERELGPHPPPTLVVLDINMPVMSGFDLLDHLHNEDELHADSTSVAVMVTSSDHPADRRRAEGYSIVDGYIEKPFTIAAVQPHLDRILASMEQPATSPPADN